MKCNARGKALIRHWEGKRLVAYLCTGRKWTCGIGARRDIHGNLVEKDTRFTEDEVEACFARDLGAVEKEISALIDDDVVLSSNEFSALCSFAFNFGVPSLARSTLMKKIRNCDPTAVKEFERWVLSDGVVTPGLVARRKAEAALFLEPDDEEMSA